LFGSALPGGKRTSPLNIWLTTPLSWVDVARCGSKVALSAAPELTRSTGRSAAKAVEPGAAQRPSAISVRAGNSLFLIIELLMSSSSVRGGRVAGGVADRIVGVAHLCVKVL